MVVVAGEGMEKRKWRGVWVGYGIGRLCKWTSGLLWFGLDTGQAVLGRELG